MPIPLRYFLAVLLGVAILAGCREEKPAPRQEKQRVFEGYHPLLDEIIRTPRGLFRGLDLNIAADSILAAEHAEPVESNADHIYYEYSADSLTDYSIDYQLRNDSLEEISVQINTGDVELGSYLYCDLKDYYAHRLPNPREDKGYVVYNCFEGQRKPFVVSLSDNSTPTRGIINMLIYKDK